MKKNISIITLFIFIVLTCTACISDAAKPPAAQATPTAQSAAPATPTPEIFIARTQAIPGEFQPTDVPQPPADTTVTYSPLTVTIPHGIAKGASGSSLPRQDGEEAAWWQKTPGHLKVSLADYYLLQGKTHEPAIYVYPASAYAELLPPAFESIHRLNNLLYEPNNIPALDQLPGVPFFNTQILFASHIQFVEFQNGSGIRYVTEYAQSPSPANNTDLFYNFIGVSGDGNWYVVAIFPLTNPVLAETSAIGAPLPERGVPYPAELTRMDTYYIAVSDLLNAQLPGSFTPSLDELDQLIQSMWIEP